VDLFSLIISNLLLNQQLFTNETLALLVTGSLLSSNWCLFPMILSNVRLKEPRARLILPSLKRI